MDLPFSFRTIPIEKSAAQTVAAMQGPVMLAAVDAPQELAATASALTNMAPAPGAPMEFDCRTASGNIRMRPFYRLRHETYSTYFRRTDA